jgi:alpha-ribazole phosphatase
MDVLLIRHTPVQIAKSVCYGQSDIPLAPTFEANAQNVLSKVQVQPGGAVYSSPLQRCIRLAEKFSRVYTTDTRLLELNFGVWENQSWEQIPIQELNPWMADFVNNCPPGGESMHMLHQRVCAFLDELQASNYNQVIVITHAGVIRSILCECLGIPLTNAFRLHIDYGSVSRIVYNNQLPTVSYTNH